MDKPRGQLYICLKKIIAEASANSASWPFMLPVAGVPDYYTVIKEPMDLKTLDDLVEKEVYKTIDEFATDLQKIFANCRAYNEDQSQYVKCANKLEKFCNEKIYRLRKEMGW